MKFHLYLIGYEVYINTTRSIVSWSK